MAYQCNIGEFKRIAQYDTTCHHLMLSGSQLGGVWGIKCIVKICSFSYGWGNDCKTAFAVRVDNLATVSTYFSIVASSKPFTTWSQYSDADNVCVMVNLWNFTPVIMKSLFSIEWFAIVINGNAAYGLSDLDKEWM